MKPIQAMPTLWDLGMCPSSYPEVNVFSGSQNSPPMEESFKDTILKALFSILISNFLAPFFQLLPSCGFFLLCHQYFLHLLFSCRSSCSFFPFFGCAVGGFSSAFPFARLYVHGWWSGFVWRAASALWIQGNAEVNTVVLDRITANSSLSI